MAFFALDSISREASLLEGLIAVLLLLSLPLGAVRLLRGREGLLRAIPAGRLLTIAFGAAALGALAVWLLHFLRAFFELDLADPGKRRALFWFILCLEAPLIEAVKALAVWPSYRARALGSGRSAALACALAGAGFAVGEAAWLSFRPGLSWLDVGRLLAGSPGHVSFALGWGYVLASRERDRFFAPAWLCAAFLTAVCRYILWVMPAGYWALLLPLWAAMLWGSRSILRSRESLPIRRSAYALLEPPSVHAIRQAFSQKGRPLGIHWIVLGALVTLGVLLTFLGGAVYIGHELGLDFALADSDGLAGIAPIALLGGALLASFPFSAYLVARASLAETVLEPAWSTAAAIALVVTVLSVSEPSALVIALGLGPVGFLLACLGAWLGLERR